MVPLRDWVVDTKLLMDYSIPMSIHLAMCFYSISHPEVESISPPLDFGLWESGEPDISRGFKLLVTGVFSHYCSLESSKLQDEEAYVLAGTYKNSGAKPSKHN